MNKISFYVHSKIQLKNKIFYPDKKDYINSDNRMLFFLELKKRFEDLGYSLNTQDINTIDESKIAIYQQIPNKKNLIKNNSYLFLLESDTVTKKNWDKNLHKDFKKIFTYKLIDDDKYVQIFNSYSFNRPILLEPKLNFKSVMICSNKKSTGKNELYSTRLNFVRYMNKYFRNNFDLFGVGWNDYSVYVDERNYKSISRIFDFVFKKFNRLLKINFKPYFVYKGTVSDKNKILQNYDFSICIENTKEENFITSIIFESMLNSSIPIYKGATNINKYVPENCYIDFDKFSNIKKLYKFINSLTYDDIMKYKKNIYNYIKNNRHEKFTSNYTIKKIIKNMDL